MPKYFKYFPIVSYGDHQLRDITRRVKFFDLFSNTPYVFLPYTITEDDRAEDIAYLYYGDSSYVWSIYLANIMIDPYYDWPMTQRNFERHVADKYLYQCASCAFASDSLFEGVKVEFLILLDACFKNREPEDVSFFEELRYRDVWDYIDNNRDSDYLINTLYTFRQVLESNDYTISFSTITDSDITDILGLVVNFTDYVFGDTIPTVISDMMVRIPDRRLLKETFDVIAWSQSLSTDIDNKAYYENIDDETIHISNDTYTTNLAFPHLNPDFESGNWRAVTYYEFEMDLNDDKRHIYLVDKKYINQIEKELTEIL